MASHVMFILNQRESIERVHFLSACMLCFFHTLAVRDEEPREKFDTYQRMIRARDVEINDISSKLSTVQKQNEELKSKL